MTGADPSVSVVIRTRNEESWIRHCLAGVFSQSGVDLEVIIVDNLSADKTIAVAESFPVSKVMRIETYSPGKALNRGIAEASGEFVALLSAHCVPTSEVWLLNLLQGFESRMTAGVYGRQIPLSFTDPVDRNDLYMAFGEEKRIQVKDWFFHNANSMIRRDVWKDVPFDAETPSIEDRIWAKTVIGKGFEIVYEPSAEVFHHNGLHRTSDLLRVRNHVEITEGAGDINYSQLPESMLPRNTKVVALVPVSQSNLSSVGFSKSLESTLQDISSADFVDEVVVVSPDGTLGHNNCIKFDRSTLGLIEEADLRELLRSTAEAFEKDNGIPDFYLYINWDHVGRPEGYFDQLVATSRQEGFDSVFGAREDFQHLWVFNQRTGDFQKVDSSLQSRSQRQPVYRAFYGLGTLTSASILRQGDLTGGRVGIVKIGDDAKLYRLRDQ